MWLRRVYDILATIPAALAVMLIVLMFNSRYYANLLGALWHSQGINIKVAFSRDVAIVIIDKSNELRSPMTESEFLGFMTLGNDLLLYDNVMTKKEFPTDVSFSGSNSLYCWRQFLYAHDSRSNGLDQFSSTTVRAPTLVVIPMALAPAIVALSFDGFRRRRNNRKIVKSICPRCGYDPRATPDRCTECGTVPALK